MLKTALTPQDLQLLQTFTKACQKSIIEMVVNANSGHPGGSLSSLDILAVLYTQIISQTGEQIVVSNGHISPAVYSVLAELGYIPKEEVVKTFRKIGSIYEGHVTRHVTGVEYGTGPLGVGVSVAASFALAEKLKAQSDSNHETKKVFAVMGDGEAQEGQVHEMIHFAKHHKLNNLIVFVDYNQVQLTASLKEIQDIDVPLTFAAGHWKLIEVDGHDYSSIWKAIQEAYNSDQPVAIIAHTIMGKNGGPLEPEGLAYKSTWHGKAPAPEMVAEFLEELKLTPEEQSLIDNFRKEMKWHPHHPEFITKLSKNSTVTVPKPEILPAGTVTDCRSAYGKTLYNLAKANPQIIALSADLKESVKTDMVAHELPKQYIECGIAEQNMVSLAGGLSLTSYIPFASTFGAFMSSRAKDQARVNDINQTNVKMVATHCGLSVGEDGPTHQAIDDMGSFLGFFNTMVIEPADANHTSHIINYVAAHNGNFYVRMGRHKFPVITKEDGTPFYDENYSYENITIAASGATIHEALKAREALMESHPNISIEIIAIGSLKKLDLDDTLQNSLTKTRKLITVEDHNSRSGLASQLALFIAENKIQLEAFHPIAVQEYQLSGTADQLYHHAGIDSEAIIKAVKSLT